MIAEAELLQIGQAPGFLPLLLQLVANPSLPGAVQLAAALFLKNQIRRRWPGSVEELGEADRQALKVSLVPALLQARTDALGRQLSEAIVLIAQQDFPSAWPALIDELLAPLRLEEIQPCLHALRTVHHLTRRYRTEFRTDDLFREINLVLQSLSPCLLELYRGLLQLAELRPAAQRTHYWRGVLLLDKILLSLCSQDLPAHVEDHLAEYYRLWQAQLGLVENNANEENLVKMVAVVGDIQTLFARRYQEDASGQIEAFAGQAAALLPRLVGQPEWERASTSLLTLLSCCSSLLKLDPAPLISTVIMPSLRLSETELEQFEDEPLEWVRHELETDAFGGDDGDGQRPTQRSAALRLARQLSEADGQARATLQEQLERLLSAYQANPVGAWREKEQALHLFAALAIRGSTSQAGVTKVEAGIDVAAFFRTHLLPDLAPTNAALQPLLKVAAIRQLLLFRSLLPPPLLMDCLPLLLHHVGSPHPAIHTLAAVCLERILQVHRPENRQALFGPEQLSEALPVVAPAILRLFTPKHHNEHLMRALMRLLGMAPRDAVARHAPTLLLPPLLSLLPQVSGHPRFCHYWFETMVVVVLAASGQEEVESLLDQLLTALQACLAEEQEALAPYCLQLIAALISRHKAGDSSRLSPRLQQVVEACLQPALWQQPSQVPPLVRLLQAALAHYPADLAPLTSTLLGIYQTLLGNRVMDVHGLALLQSMLMTMYDSLSNASLSTALVILLRRLQQPSRPPRLLRAALLTLLTWANVRPAQLWAAFEGCQTGLMAGLFGNVLLAGGDLAGLRGKGKERDWAQLGLIRLVGLAEMASTPAGLQCWTLLVSQLTGLLTNSSNQVASGEPEDEVTLEETMIESGSYSRLLYLPPAIEYPPMPANLQLSFIEALKGVTATYPDGRAQAALQAGLEGGQLDLLRELFTRHGTKL